MNKFSLDNHVILITGASSGIGRACAIETSNAGANCILVGRNENALKETAGLCKNKAEILVCDLRQPDEIKKIVSLIGKIDGVVHCAGITYPRPVKFLKPEHIKEIFDINYNAPVLLTAELMQTNKLNEGASFVFISSISSKHPYFGGATYVSSKAALEAFSRALAIEIAPKKMRSNVIMPALVYTKMLEDTKLATGDSRFNEYEKMHPLGFGEAKDVADAACFFLSKEAKWITGSELKMDGGLLLNGKIK
ncbi:MAG: family oxidoreductase [Bacteroidota bacterium]|nr:family oxidoreductase [Bacteroidota bacterium]